jgi:acyl-CoA thioester hydrolase
VEAHVIYQGRARYDDLLEMKSVMSRAGKASFRFDMSIVQAHGGAAVAAGYTVHACTNGAGKPIRCPAWLTETLEAARAPAAGVGA